MKMGCEYLPSIPPSVYPTRKRLNPYEQIECAEQEKRRREQRVEQLEAVLSALETSNASSTPTSLPAAASTSAISAPVVRESPQSPPIDSAAFLMPARSVST